MVLPLPDSPTRPSTSPGLTASEMSTSAWTSWPSCLNVFDPCSTSRSGLPFAIRAAAGSRAGATRGSSCARSWKWQRLARPWPSGKRSGSCSRQTSLASPQRGSKTQPGRLGTEPGEEPRDRVQRGLVLPQAAARDAAEKADRVGVPRVAEDLLGGPLFDEPAGIEHADALAHLRDDREVVADEQDARPELLAQRRDEVEHLRLDSRV